MILLLLTTTFTFNSWNPTQDRIAHFGMGYGVGSFAYTYQVWQGEDNWKEKIVMSITAGIVAGYMKEGYDLMHGGEADGFDWLYTITGAVIGTFISDWLFNQNDDGGKYEIRG